MPLTPQGPAAGRLPAAVIAESPPRKIEDIHNALTFLADQPSLDPDRLAVLGIGVGAGYVAAEAAEDSRVRALALVAPCSGAASYAVRDPAARSGPVASDSVLSAAAGRVAGMGTTPRAGRDQVLAFRLAGHHLDRRLPPGSLLAAAAACGVQDSPPGSAALALHARVGELTPADIDRALAQDNTLLAVWSLRLAPCLVPTADAAVFTAGVLPGDEASLRAAMPGPAAALGRVGVTLTEAVEATVTAAREVLDGRTLTKGELSGEISGRLPDALTPWCEPCQAHHVPETVFRALGPSGVACLAPRTGNTAVLVRTDQWLGAGAPAECDPELARAELVRRYLRCYGPSTPDHLAKWAGIGPADARRSWRLVEPELAEVTLEGGGRAWLLGADSARLAAPPAAGGVRLLPPSDPYLALRDRDTLLPDRALHRRVWRPIGSPGVVLLDGRVAGTWRPRKQGRRLTLTVEPFERVAPPARDAIQAEAERAAPHRGATTAEVLFAGS